MERVSLSPSLSVSDLKCVNDDKCWYICRFIWSEAWIINSVKSAFSYCKSTPYVVQSDSNTALTISSYTSLLLTTPLLVDFSWCITQVTQQFTCKHCIQAKCVKASVVHPLSKVILVFKDRESLHAQSLWLNKLILVQRAWEVVQHVNYRIDDNVNLHGVQFRPWLKCCFLLTMQVAHFGW